ncbi:MAG: hypothetical protein RJA70_2197 [Pseudomonadota bacterium]|jgi:biopolymer transport protein ExbB
MSIQVALGALVQLGAQWVLWFLLALSVVGVGIIIERGIFFMSSRESLEKLQTQLRQHLPKGQFERLRALLSESPSFEARVAARALSEDGESGADEQMQSEAEQSRLEMERHLAFLGTVGSNAPFVGLLGTVIGIIGAFQELDRSQGALTTGLMSEIGEALLATAVGLLVALPAIAAYNIFRRLIQTRMGRIEVLRQQVLGHLKQRARLTADGAE